MANKSLNDKYNIPFGSEWEHKDGGKYMALLIKHLIVDTNIKVPIVLYVKLLTDEDTEYFKLNNIKNQFARTVEHFKNSFNQIELKE